jgi:hypothetical protein
LIHVKNSLPEVVAEQSLLIALSGVLWVSRLRRFFVLEMLGGMPAVERSPACKSFRRVFSTVDRSRVVVDPVSD